MRLSADDQAERSSASLGAVGQRFCKKLVRSPRASNGNRGGEFQPPVAMVKTKALKHRLIQFNGPRYISYFVFDVDRQAAALAWQARTSRPRLSLLRTLATPSPITLTNSRRPSGS